MWASSPKLLEENRFCHCSNSALSNICSMLWWAFLFLNLSWYHSGKIKFQLPCLFVNDSTWPFGWRLCASQKGEINFHVCAGSYLLQGNVQVEKGIKHSVIFIYYSFQVDNVQWFFFLLSADWKKSSHKLEDVDITMKHRRQTQVYTSVYSTHFQYFQLYS